MSNSKHRLRSTILGALAFGFGFVLGSLVTNLILTMGWLDSLMDRIESGRLVLGLLLSLSIAGLGGAVAGAFGGVALSYAHQTDRRWGYAWRGALSFGIAYGLVLVPLILAVAVMAFYNLDDLSPIRLMIPLGVLGVAFGAVSGLILGLLTVGRKFWRVGLTAAIWFALSGATLGYAIAGYILQDEVSAGNWVLFAGIFAFGAIGGGALGNLYDKLARPKPKKPSMVSRFGAWYKQASTIKRVAAVVGLILLVLALRTIWIISPFNSYKASLNKMMASNTVTTHWSSPVRLIGDTAQPAIFVAENNEITFAWVEGTDVHYLVGNTDTSVNISNSATPSTNPQLVIDSNGLIHVVWEEGGQILYSRCDGTTCVSPLTLSSVTGLDCLTASSQNDQPALAIDAADTLMAVWRADQQSLPYSIWSAADTPIEFSAGCVPSGQQDRMLQSPRLADIGADTFSLVFAQLNNPEDGEIFLTEYAGDNWSTPELMGAGHYPEIFVDDNRQTHVAWCNPGKALGYWNSTTRRGRIPFPGCTSRPGLAVAGNKSPRLIWYSDEVKNATETVKPNTLIYESLPVDNSWTDPAIVALTTGTTQPAMTVDSNGVLHLAWTDSEPGQLNYATHTELDCTGVELSTPAQAVYETVRQKKFRPPTDPIPYCGNQYNTLLHAPNPVAAFSDQTPTPNGTFDKFAELAKTAEYEVVFATMWYDSYNKGENPGRVLGKAIAKLYQDLKDNPSRYPKGLTVRILLGNPPSFAFLPGLNNQTWSLIEDLRAAGVPEMQNEELGWNLEVANFSGAWPHSHMKQMVVDGKTVQSVGYNMQYTHLPTDHPSGKGKGRVDLGLQVSGPAAQVSLRAFDDLWQASTQMTCSNIDPKSSVLWAFSCKSQPTESDHVPEVLRYYVPEGKTSNAYAIYRTQDFKESDEAYGAAMASAQESIDIVHINFSLELICALNIFIDACTYADRAEYMDALMYAVEENDAHLRILTSDVAWVGIENNIAIEAFEDELAKRGLSDNVEIRFFEQDMHIKAALIDEDMLILGNQNLHYSAWGGEGTLAEYNLVTGSPDAVEDFQRYFNYYWDRAKTKEAAK